LFVVGRIRRPHGVSGETSLEPLRGFFGELSPGSSVLWSRGGEVRNLTIVSTRRHAERLLIRFEGVDDLEAARALTGGDLGLSQAPPAPADFYYSHEIAGWRCEDGSGRPIGVATGVEETPGGALLRLETPEGKEVLVPFVRPIVIRIERGEGRIVLDLPEGLLEL
jgi:16S rRNA processing protein RimM